MLSEVVVSVQSLYMFNLVRLSFIYRRGASASSRPHFHMAGREAALGTSLTLIEAPLTLAR